MFLFIYIRVKSDVDAIFSQINGFLEKHDTSKYLSNNTCSRQNVSHWILVLCINCAVLCDNYSYIVKLQTLLHVLFWLVKLITLLHGKALLKLDKCRQTVKRFRAYLSHFFDFESSQRISAKYTLHSSYFDKTKLRSLQTNFRSSNKCKTFKPYRIPEMFRSI